MRHEHDYATIVCDDSELGLVAKLKYIVDNEIVDDIVLVWHRL